eukprot:gene32326-41888_t
MDTFVAAVNSKSPGTVFQSGGGWFKLEYWWSGVHLLHVIKQTILQPELMQKTAFPNLTIPQAVYAYVHAITERDFPRLLVLLFELGGANGVFLWDGDEVSHSWN